MNLNLVQKTLSVIWPKTCAVCDLMGAYVCESCQKELELNPSNRCSTCYLPFVSSPLSHECPECLAAPKALNQHQSLVRFNDITSKWVHGLKYQHQFWVTNLFQELLSKTDLLFKQPIDWVIPIPLHSNKIKERGFNQSERLGQVVQKIINKPLQKTALKRIKNTPSQTGLSRVERQSNLKDAFEYSKNGFCAKTVLLVDDVYTTGATLNAAARILKQAGAQEVYGLTLAIRERL